VKKLGIVSVYLYSESVIAVLDLIIGRTLRCPHSFSLSFARDKYIDTYIERHIEGVILWILWSPSYKKEQGLSIVSSFLFYFYVKICKYCSFFKYFEIVIFQAFFRSSMNCCDTLMILFKICIQI
jgi:hypothetical protein